MSELNSMYKALGAGLVSVALLAGCASAKTAPSSAEAAPAPAPEAETAPEPVAAPTPPPDDVHVVVAGEHLWGISGYSNIYNDPYQWPLIYRHNRNDIRDADLIYPGQKLMIKRDWNSEQIDQAIKHAKMRGAWSLGPTEDSDLDYLFEAY